MQKKIIVLAIAAAFSAPAFADTANVTVYGAVNMAVDSVSVGNGAAAGSGNSYSDSKISSNVTKLGFKGAEDLGDGVSGIWQLEQQIDADNSSATTGANGYQAQNTLATRNSFVGLSDKSMGTVQLGKMDTPFKSSVRGLDLFDGTIADNRSLLGGVKGLSAGATFEGRQPDSIAYTSPVMGGVTVAAAYVFGAENANAATVNKGSAVSLAAMYKSDNLFGTLAYEVHNFGDANTGDMAGNAVTTGQKESAVRLGVGYTMDAFQLNAVVERTDDNLAPAAADTNVYGHTAYYLGGKFNLSSANSVKLAYSHANKTNAVNNAGGSDAASQVSLGFDHNLSKATSVFALYSLVSNDDQGQYGLTTASSTGGTGNLATAYAGAKVSVVSLGLKHAF